MRRQRTFKRREIGRVDEYSINENALLFFDAGFGATKGGMMFGSWIDENSRSNGYNEGDLIDNPAYVVESLLRDVLNVPTEKIDYASFDVAGNTTNGILDGWSFTGGIYSVANIQDILDNALKQCKSQLYINPDGKFSLITYSATAAADYTDYTFDTTNNITNLEVFQTSYEDIVSEVRINFALDRATGKYRKVSFIKAKKRFSGTYLNEAIDLTESAWDVDDGTKFQRENAAGACTDNLAGLGAGNLSNGVYYYKVTFVTAVGETEAGTASGGVTVADSGTNGQVALTDIPLGNSLVTSRKIYRTTAGGSNYNLVDTLSNNTITTYTDNIADGSLGAAAPTANSTGYYLYILTNREVNAVLEVTGNTITLINVAGDRSTFFNSVAAVHDDNTQIWIIDKSSDAGDGGTADTTREGYACETIWKYNAQNRIEIDADWIIDQTTAVLLRNYYLDWYYVPHWTIEFDAFLRTSDLKVGNIVTFDATIMNAYMYLGGENWTSKKFRVTSISRSGSMIFHIKAIEI